MCRVKTITAPALASEQNRAAELEPSLSSRASQYESSGKRETVSVLSTIVQFGGCSSPSQ